MAEIRLRCKRRADKETDLSVSDPEWNALISETWGELYNSVAATGLRYFESTSSIPATGATTYTLPTDHLATIGLDRIVNSTGQRFELMEIMPQERGRFSGQVGDGIVYTIIGQAISIFPRPPSGSYELIYIPQPPDISNNLDNTTVDLVNADGEKFLIWATAMMARDKGENDVQVAMHERDAAKQRLVDWATMRAFTQPRRIVALRNGASSDWWGDDWGDGGLPGGWWDR